MQSKLEDCDLNTPRNENTLSHVTPKGTTFVQMNFARSNAKKEQTKARTVVVVGDLEKMEDKGKGQLGSKVDSVAETPKQNNLEKFKVGSRVNQDNAV